MRDGCNRPAAFPVPSSSSRACVRSQMPQFATLREFEAHLRHIYAPFGHLSDEEWTAMAMSSHRRTDAGAYTMHYDPKILHAFAEHSSTFNCWDR